MRRSLSDIKQILFAGIGAIWIALLPVPFSIAFITGNQVWLQYIWISSFILSAAAWINFITTEPHGLKKFSKQIALGITAGAIADLYGTCLAKHFNIQPLLVTAPLFALGHLFYTAGILTAVYKLNLNQHRKWRPSFVVSTALYAVIGFILWKTLVHSSEVLPTAHLPLAAYTAVLAAAATIMLTAAITDSSFTIIAVGGFLFLASDGLLAVKIFQNNIYHIGDFCWLIYGIGQMLITYGTVYTSERQKTIDA